MATRQAVLAGRRLLGSQSMTGEPGIAVPDVGFRVIFRWFWPATRPYRGRMLISLLLVGVVTWLDIAHIWVFKLLIDDVLAPRNFDAFVPVLALYLGVALAQGVSSFCDEWLATWLGERFILDLRTRLFDHLHRLSVDFFDRRLLGDTLSRLTGDIGAIEALVLTGVTRAVSYGLEIILSAGVLFYLNWNSRWCPFLPCPLSCWCRGIFLGGSRMPHVRNVNGQGRLPPPPKKA